MPIKKEDLEVIEETINDFEYFYDEDETTKRNRKIILKYRLISIGFITVICLFLITILGISRMKIYGTDNILTKNEMLYVEIKNECDDMMEQAQEFYACNYTSGILDSTCSYYQVMQVIKNYNNEYNVFINKEFGSNTILGWNETFTIYSERLDEILNSNGKLIPKKEYFEDYLGALKDYIDKEILLIDRITSEETFEGLIKGNVDLSNNEKALNESYKNLAITHNTIIEKN